MNRRPDVKAEPSAHLRFLREIRASHSVGRDGLSDNEVVRRTVLIVDDHEGFRASARALLEAEGFEVVGEAADGPGAIEAVALLQPNVVLLDIQLPGLDGLAVAEQLAAAPDPPVVVLTSSRDSAAYGVRLGMSSARGFIPKSELSGKALLALVG
jgi:DNA-binding NarL/FixJ family response regulator